MALLCEYPGRPEDLLHIVKAIEKDLGRKSLGRWSPREIDIDILVWEQARLSILSREGLPLEIPHAALFERPFALLPLADLWPEWRINNETSTAAQRAEPWRDRFRAPLGTRRSKLSLVRLVGVLNLSPDSFSDGGRYQSFERALERYSELVQQGAETVDVGAESTRPGAEPLTALQEWARLETFLTNVRISHGVGLSIDTRHVEVARRATEHEGVECLNDVSGFRDPAMRALARDKKLFAILMHSLSVPARKDLHLDPACAPSEQLLTFARKALAEWTHEGGDPYKIAFDPGLGFGKTAEQSWILVRELRAFHELGVPVYVGHSRKSFLSEFRPGLAPDERDLESAVLSVDLARKGASFVRVHDVESSRRGLEIFQQSDGVVKFALHS
jgi:2-amino-4-hydroxy-6-hydroxymethyldihydropteridine diphosphokinase/dihydropteroate synthase